MYYVKVVKVPMYTRHTKTKWPLFSGGEGVDFIVRDGLLLLVVFVKHGKGLTVLTRWDALTRAVCAEKWPSPEQDDYYTIALLTTQFIVPLVVLIFTYTRIAIVVWGKRPPGEAENSRDQRMAKSKRKVGGHLFLVRARAYTLHRCVILEANRSGLRLNLPVPRHIDREIDPLINFYDPMLIVCW
uniref:G-protein coupled receptors family 1 profile domain-containing protein n=1 Tax=Anopheles maculatus TaxID=74869 RepID=A0A182T3Y3_9DIPT